MTISEHDCSNHLTGQHVSKSIHCLDVEAYQMKVVDYKGVRHLGGSSAPELLNYGICGYIHTNQMYLYIDIHY